MAKNEEVDRYNGLRLDRLPVPFGLVRYGVAPDHHSIRSIRNKAETDAGFRRLIAIATINFRSPRK